MLSYLVKTGGIYGATQFKLANYWISGSTCISGILSLTLAIGMSFLHTNVFAASINVKKEIHGANKTLNSTNKANKTKIMSTLLKVVCYLHQSRWNK